MSESQNAGSTLPTRALRIGDVTIELNYRRVERDGASVELPQRPFDLLCLFLSEPHTLHTRKDLFRRVWKGAVVEDSNLTQSVWLLRRALGEPGKDWIRTVAKSGYVFDPPFTIQTIDQAVNDDALPVAADDDTPSSPAASASPAPEPVSAFGRAWRRFSAVAAVLAALALVAGFYRHAPADPEPLRVVLITVDPHDAAGSQIPQWPQQLLREWLEWKLSREPGALVVTAPQLAGANRNGRVVLLSVAAGLDEPSRLRMYAHLSDADGARDVVVEGSLESMPQAADRVSTDVVNLLLPGRERRYPPVAIDVETARDYAAAIQRRAARRPGEAIAAFEATLRQAQEFGLARTQLAELYGEMGKVSAAKQQLATADAWISALPPDALRVQQAQQLMLRRDYAAAVDAYTALVGDYPRQPQYRLALAHALTRAQRSHDALAALDLIDWSTQPMQSRVDASLERAEAQREAGALDDARRTARQADEMAAETGWPLERGRALLIFAKASTNDDSTDKWLAFDRAATQFELAGDRIGALTAQLGGETMRPFSAEAGADRAADARLSALLGEARTAGNREVEIDALRLTARRLRRAGDFIAAHDRLAEASAVARAEGDLERDSALQMDFALVTMGLGDYDAAERHLAAIDRSRAQGSAQWWQRLFAAKISLRRGRLDEAEKNLGPVPGQEATLPVAAMLECDRAELERRRGDIVAARSAAQRCMRSELPYDIADGRIELGAIAQDAGDSAQAMHEVDLAGPSIEKLSQVDRWQLEAVAMRVRVRAGEWDDAQRVLSDVATRARAGGMRVIEVEARLGLAEIALARGDLAAVDAQTAAARFAAPAADWSVSTQISLLDAARDYARGEPSPALEQLRDVDAQARAHGDVALELDAHALAAAWGDRICPVARDDKLSARDGLRGIAGRWLLRGRSTVPIEGLADHKPRPR